MIRVNLLAVERERSKKPLVAISAAQRVTIGASLLLLLTVLGIGWWFWSLRQQSLALDREIAKAEGETQQLRSVLSQVQKFETRKAQLQQRVTLIEQLRRGQSGPVHVLDKVSRSLPERLWLTDMKQTGAEFTISGFSTSMTALSDFVGNLETTTWFKRPVEIIDSLVQDDPKTGELVKFSIKATFTDPNAPATPPSLAAPKPGGRGGAAPKGGR
ncbi:MAG TPA: PilN domain-containing protein [Vicinamibacterales bacterium]|nr:PilN domain-containing protein [Vicinamibacterales bacterium]